MNMFRSFIPPRPPSPEVVSAASEAAHILAGHRTIKGREPIRAVARQICAELGQPVPPALQESR